jgi:hypothetical protein
MRTREERIAPGIELRDLLGDDRRSPIAFVSKKVPRRLNELPPLSLDRDVSCVYD